MMTAINGAMLAAGSSLAGLILVKVTVVAALGLAAAWLARRSRAAVRHALLAVTFGATLVLPIASTVAAPIQVTVPVAEGSRAAWPLVVNTTAPIPPVTAEADGARVTPVSPQQSSTFSLSALLLAGWIVGTAVFLVPVMTGLWQIRSLRRSGLRWLHGQSIAETLALDAGIHRRVEVLLHEAVPGPITCGVLRPAILLPRDAKTWTREDLSRAIVHELEHVRRGDSATRCLARAVCALYWFHPLVWVAWRKLALEAERSCDDAVLRRSEATAYADQLVGLAKRLPAAQKLLLLAMVNRSDLATRVGAVLDMRQQRGRAGMFSVAIACAAAVLLVTVLSPLMLVAAPQSQSADVPDWQTAAGGRMTFEVASVRPSKDFKLPNFDLSTGNAVAPGGRFFAGFPLLAYITFAYKLNQTEEQMRALLARAPKWVNTDYFEIDARAAGNPTKDQMRLMMQSLLADRFKLAVHFETSDVPVLALTLDKPGKLGPKLRPHSEGPPCPEFKGFDPASRPEPVKAGDVFPAQCDVTELSGAGGFLKVGSRNATMQLLAELVQVNGSMSGESDKPVVDKTGLKGTFDYTIEYSGRIGPLPPGVDAPPPGPQGTSFLQAVRQQLGLKLESSRAPIRTIVIDHVEEPSQN